MRKSIIFVKHVSILFIKNFLLKKKEKQLKSRLLKIHKEVRRLANPNLTLKTKRRILQDSQVGKGVFSALSTIVVPTLLSLLAKK